MALGLNNTKGGNTRGTIGEQSVGRGGDYVAWLEEEPKRRLAAILAKDKIMGKNTPVNHGQTESPK